MVITCLAENLARPLNPEVLNCQPVPRSVNSRLALFLGNRSRGWGLPKVEFQCVGRRAHQKESTSLIARMSEAQEQRAQGEKT